MKFSYKAVNLSGKQTEGILEATDKRSVITTLRERSLFPLEVREVPSPSVLNMEIGSSKIPKKALGLFCSQFASILKAGVPTAQALSIITEQTEHKKLKKILITVSEEIQKGFTLSQALGQHRKALPDMLISMIEAGEASGTLDLSLHRLAVQFDKENRLHDKVKSATTYPIIVGGFAIVMVIAMIIFVIPLFVSIFEQTGAPIPALTQFLINLSKFIQNQWILIICAVVLLIFAWKAYKKSEKGRYAIDRIKLRLPLIGKINLKLMAARFSRTLCTLISSGVSLPESMSITGRAISNKFAEKKVDYVEGQIKEGKTLSSSFALMGLLPNMLIQMTKIGEESGTLDYMLDRTADYYEQEAESSIQRLATMLEPMMIIFVGALVLVIALSILMPVFQMSSSINNKLKS